MLYYSKTEEGKTAAHATAGGDFAGGGGLHMTSAGVHLIYNYIGSILLLTHTHAPALKGRVAWGDTVAWGEGGGGGHALRWRGGRRGILTAAALLQL